MPLDYATKQIALIKPYFFILFLLSAAAVSAREPLILHVKDVAKQDAADRLRLVFALEYSWQKDTANYVKIDSLEALAETLGDQTLEQFAQLYRHEYRIYFAKNAQEKRRFFEAALQFAQNTGNPELPAHLYYATGIYDFYLKRVEEGLPLVFQAKKMLEGIQYQSFPHATYYDKGFFDLYLYFEDFHSAIFYGKAALDHTNDLLYFPADYCNNIAVCYHRIKEYDSALQYYQKALADARSRSDTFMITLAEGNIARLYVNDQQFEKALPYFYKDFQLNEKGRLENSLRTRYGIANCLLMLDSVEKAATFLIEKNARVPIWEYPGHAMEKYEVMALYHQKTGNYKKAGEYKDSLIILKDSLKVLYDLNKLKNMERLLQAEKFLTEKAELELNTQKQKFIRNSIIGVLASIFIIFILWLTYRHKKENEIKQQKQLLAEQKQLQAEDLLAHANRQLNQYLENIREKNNLIDQITTQLAAANAANALPDSEKERYLQDLLNTIILTEEDWIDFKNLFEGVFPGFFSHLSQSYPNLTAAEIRLLALEKLDLPDKDMANMLGISTDSIKKARYRLRKKHPELLREV